MKIGLVLPGNIWKSPYINIYTKMLDEWQVEYEIISWNRDARDSKIGFQFTCDNKKNTRLSKFVPYLKYVSFVKETIRKQKFDKLIVFGPQIAILLYRFLKKNYSNKYILDYRDLSIEQKALLKSPFLTVLKNSYANVISSPGFKKCLPSGFDYILSHNFDIDVVRKALLNKQATKKIGTEFDILTIGGIRDYTSNIEVVKALMNKKDFRLHFVGSGIAAKPLESFCNENKITNVDFVGYYRKEQEGSYIEDATMLNIFYPKIISHSTALSNRFYNALIYKKPMLVTSNSTQGDFVEKYSLGLAVDNCDDLDIKIKEFFKNFDLSLFQKNSDKLLETFIDDYNKLERTVKTFIS